MARKSKTKKRVKVPSLITTWVTRVQLTAFGLSNAERYSRDFNSCKYTLVQRINQGNGYDKPQLMEYFQLPSRMFNTALNEAEGAISSVQELAADHKLRLERQSKEAKQWAKFKRLKRLKNSTEQCLWESLRGYRAVQDWEWWDQQAQQPTICFGYEQFRHNDSVRDEQRVDWKKKVDCARYGHFGAVGSKDESAGNSTFKAVYLGLKDGEGQFRIYHQCKVFGEFKLDQKRSQVLAGYLAEEKALQVMFYRHDHRKKHRWHVHVTLREEILAPITSALRGMMGMDMNHDCFCWSRVSLKGRILEYCQAQFPESDTREARLARLEEQLRHMVDVAKKHRIPIAIESLNLEGAKGKAKSRRMRRVLHGIPYKQVREMLIRLCARAQVELIEVWAAYSSLLGAFVSGKYPKLSRDVAASVILAHRGFAARNVKVTGWKQWLTKRAALRLNVKGVMGRTIQLQLDPQQRSMLAEMTDAQVGRLLVPAFRRARKEIPLKAHAELRRDRLRFRFEWLKPAQKTGLGTASVKPEAPLAVECITSLQA